MARNFRSAAAGRDDILPLGSALPFVRVTLAALLVDILTFSIMARVGAKLGFALASSFLIASALRYFLTMRLAAASGDGLVEKRTSIDTVCFIGICLFGFGLRGGLFADAQQFMGLSPLASICVGAFGAAVVCHFGHYLQGHRLEGERRSSTWWTTVAIGAVAYMLALRLTFLGVVNLTPEEAYYWNFSQHPDIGYLDHPPMSAWMIWLGTHVFGNTEFGVRIGAYFAWMAVCAFLYRLTANLFGKAAAVTGLVLTAVLPVFFYTGFMMTPDVPLTVAWAGALFFLERSLLANRAKAWWGVGLCAGLGMISKYTMGLLGPAVLIFVIIDPNARRWLKRPEPYLAAFLALLLFSPVIYWNAVHGWASFAFQSTDRLKGAAVFSTPDLFFSAALLLTPTGLVSALAIFVSRRLRVVLAPEGDREAARRVLFSIVFSATPLFVFLAFSVAHQVKFDWTGPVWLAILPAVAALISATPSGTSWIGDRIQKLWNPTLFATVAIYAVFLHYMVLGLPFAGHFGSIRTLPVAWDEFGRQVGVIQQSLERETGQEALIAGMDKYYVTSEVAFYNRQRAGAALTSVGGGPLGNESLMYDFWYKPAEMLGRNFILVGVKRSDVEQSDLPRYFARLTDIRTESVVKNGALVGQFYYRIGYAYRR